METVPLLDRCQLTIGRSPECDVSIDDPTLAERHAVLLLGPPVVLVDLGAGPTTVGAARLSAGARALLSPGVVVMLGGVTIVLQAAAASVRLRHVRSHDYFQRRVEDECARIDEDGGSFAIALFDLLPGTSARAEGPIATSIRPMDLLATHTPEQYEVLLPAVDPEQAKQIVETVVERIRAVGEDALTAVACYPRDACTPEALFAFMGQVLNTARAPESAPALAVATMDRLRPMVERVATSALSVLILGETGVGKEVMATAIHALSPRHTKPMVCLNCAAVSEPLMEGELFGYERGAFTGAVKAKAGLLEAAHGGTVFLDEIGDMLPSVQARLLRVIEQRMVTRLGALTPRAIDVRFIAATNRNLEEEVARGAFRRDLYFRLNGFTLSIPPLRERAGEIEPLAARFIAEACADAGRARPPELSMESLRALQSYTWPGNIRELRNTIQRAVLLCTGDIIDCTHLPIEDMGKTAASYARQAPAVESRPMLLGDCADESPRPPQSQSRPSSAHGDPERDRILEILERCAGNQTRAAALIGISRGTLISRIEKYKLPRPKKLPE
jgi:DNA-binding NtrC family response regulator